MNNKIFDMGSFKAFLLGIGVSFVVYYLNKKDMSGRSVLDDIIDDPKTFVDDAKNQLIGDVVETVKERLA